MYLPPAMIQPGDLVWYQLERIRDGHFAGVYHVREVVAEVVRITDRRVVIRPYYDGYGNPPDRVRAVSKDKVR